MLRQALVVLAALSGCALPNAVAPIASPVAVARSGEVVISLSEEPCALGPVANLPWRAVWEERGQRHAGCWAVQHGRAVVTYWSDRTVVVLPIEIFLAGRAL